MQPKILNFKSVNDYSTFSVNVLKDYCQRRVKGKIKCIVFINRFIPFAVVDKDTVHNDAGTYGDLNYFLTSFVPDLTLRLKIRNAVDRVLKGSLPVNYRE